MAGVGSGHLRGEDVMGFLCMGAVFLVLFLFLSNIVQPCFSEKGNQTNLVPVVLSMECLSRREFLLLEK